MQFCLRVNFRGKLFVHAAKRGRRLLGSWDAYRLEETCAQSRQFTNGKARIIHIYAAGICGIISTLRVCCGYPNCGALMQLRRQGIILIGNSNRICADARAASFKSRVSSLEWKRVARNYSISAVWWHVSWILWTMPKRIRLRVSVSLALAGSLLYVLLAQCAWLSADLWRKLLQPWSE